MGRLSEFIHFINQDRVPSEHEMAVMYSCIGKTKELMDARKVYRKGLKKEETEKKDQMSLFFP